MCIAQPNLKPDLMIGFGASSNLFNQENVKGLQGGAYGINAGFFSNKELYHKYSIFLGITYNRKWADNYQNQFNYLSNWVGGPEPVIVYLNTSIKQDFFETPIILKYKIAKLTIGAGINLSYLLISQFSQKVTGKYAIAKYPAADADFDAKVHYVFEIKNYEYTSAFSKVNIAPLINIGYKFNKRFAIEYLCNYDLITNPYFNFKFNNFNLLNNNLLLTLKIN